MFNPVLYLFDIPFMSMELAGGEKPKRRLEKMDIRDLLGFAMIASLVMAAPMVQAFDARGLENRMLKESDLSLKDVKQVAESLAAQIPTTYQAAMNATPIKARYLVWTKDGTHIMWGYYGKDHFVGTDDLGKNAWGIYGKTVFAGLYDGKFFYGKFSHGNWKAFGLFHLNQSEGRFVEFPMPKPVEALTARK